MKAAPQFAIAIFLATTAARADDAPPKDAGTDLTVVGGKEAETAGSVHSVKKKQLERFKYDDPTAVFLGVPGVYARGEDGYGLRPNIGIRGGNSDRSKKVTLMEDGVLFGPAPYSAPAAYYFPIIGRMRAVRIVKGPSAIIYGPQTIGGAIDLVTEDVPTTPHGMFDLAFGNYGYTKAHARQGLSGDTVGVLVEGINLTSTGFKQLDGGGDTGFVRRELMGKVGWLLPGNARVQHDLGLKVTYSSEISNETYLGLTDADFRKTPYRRYVSSKLDKMDLGRFSVVATHHARFDGNLEITTNAYRHDYHRIWRKVNGLRGTDIRGVLAAPDAPSNQLFYGVLTGAADSTGPESAILIGPNDRTFVSQGVQTVARWTVKSDDFENRLEYGARVHYDSIERRHSQEGFLMRAGQLVSDGRPNEITADNKASTLALALYAANSLAWKRLIVTPGIRAEILRSQFDDYAQKTRAIGTEQVFLPGLGTYVAITKNLGAIAGVYRGYSPPPPGSTAVTRAEDAINYEGGFRFTSKRLRAEILGFFNNYRNLTDVCTFSNGCVGADQDRQFDAGAVHVYGTESFVESEIRTPIGVAIPLRLSYTLTRTRFLSSFTSADPQFGEVTVGDELPYVPRHQLAAMVGAETKKWGVAFNALYISRMRETAGQGAMVDALSTDASVVLDVSGSYKLTSWLGVYVNARNLTNQAYLVGRRPFGARPGAPRMLQAGLKIDL
jgi:Fe(3+) dicitrate transport protein